MVKTCRYPNFCAGWTFTFLACGAGDRIKPGVERGSAEPQVRRVIYHTSPRTRATAIDAASMIMKERITKYCRPLCGLDEIGYAVLLGWSSAARNPRYNG